MDAIELLETQHEEVKQLFKKCEKARGESKRQLFEQIPLAAVPGETGEAAPI